MIQLPLEPKVIEKDGNRAMFEIGPLYPGYGVTIGNVLRRVLISSIDGAAITAVKITGVDHEFSAIHGIQEDVIQIILNLKKVRFKLGGTEPVTLLLSAKGKGVVTASDIKTTNDIEVVNPEQKIATITDAKTTVEMELKIEYGVGYVPVELRHKDKLSVGEIAIDGIFTPIRNVNFTVENIRVGQRTDFNKVLLNVETDGSMSPEMALKRSCDILLEHVKMIAQVKADEEPVKPKKASKKKA